MSNSTQKEKSEVEDAAETELNGGQTAREERQKQEYKRLLTWGKMFLKGLNRDQQIREMTHFIKALLPGSEVVITFKETKKKSKSERIIFIRRIILSCTNSRS